MQVQDLAGRLTITVPEAGELLGLGRGSAYAAAGRGDIPTLRMGGRLLVPVASLLGLLGCVADQGGVRSALAADTGVPQD